MPGQFRQIIGAFSRRRGVARDTRERGEALREFVWTPELARASQGKPLRFFCARSPVPQKTFTNSQNSFSDDLPAILFYSPLITYTNERC